MVVSILLRKRKKKVSSFFLRPLWGCSALCFSILQTLGPFSQDQFVGQQTSSPKSHSSFHYTQIADNTNKGVLLQTFFQQLDVGCGGRGKSIICLSDQAPFLDCESVRKGLSSILSLEMDSLSPQHKEQPLKDGTLNWTATCHAGHTKDFLWKIRGYSVLMWLIWWHLPPNMKRGWKSHHTCLSKSHQWFFFFLHFLLESLEQAHQYR